MIRDVDSISQLNIITTGSRWGLHVTCVVKVIEAMFVITCVYCVHTNEDELLSEWWTA